jgi:hypothetical protein
MEPSAAARYKTPEFRSGRGTELVPVFGNNTVPRSAMIAVKIEKIAWGFEPNCSDIV